MRLGGTLIVDMKIHQYLATLKVQSDTATKKDTETIRRAVTGTITDRGPFWGEYVGFCTRYGHVQEDGHDFFPALALDVDFDVYALFQTAFMSIEGTTVHLLLAETFFDPLDGYEKVKRERNQEKQRYVDRLISGRMTKNDLREMRGLPREPRFDTPIDPNSIPQLQALYLKPDNSDLWNVLC